MVDFNNTQDVKRQWSKLTDADVEAVKGNQGALVGKIQERYGISKEEAEAQVRNLHGSDPRGNVPRP